MVIKYFLFFIVSYFLIYNIILLPTIPNQQTKMEMEKVARHLGTPNAIHNYLWQKNNYTFNDFPNDINSYWKTRKGDCTEVAYTEVIMLKAIGLKARVEHGYKNNTRHDYVVVGGEAIFEDDVVAWYQKIMKYKTKQTNPIM